MSLLHLFLCFAFVAGSYLVVRAINAIQAVIFLIITFCIAGLMLFLLHSEFFGLLLIIVYVGAIAVLFLFVVMMLKNKTFGTGNILNLFGDSFLEIAINVLFVYAFFFVLLIAFSSTYRYVIDFDVDSLPLVIDALRGIDILGQVLYNFLYLYVLLCGFILLLALMGPIVLTLGGTKASLSDLHLLDKKLSADQQLAKRRVVAYFN